MDTLFQILFLLQAVSTLSRNVEQQRYASVFACEGETLRIDCGEGEVIQLIRANYGRFSITKCNRHGKTDLNVDCMSPKSLRVVHSQCSHKRNCSVQAHTSLFTDQCPGTAKYLEAHYLCMPTTFPTRSSYLRTSQIFSTQRTSQSTIITTTYVPTFETTLETTTFVPKVIKNDYIGMCSPVSARGIAWDYTPVGDKGARPCPPPATGIATWACLPGDPPYRSQHPKLTLCRSPNLSDLESRISSITIPAYNLFFNLTETISNLKLFGGDILSTTRIMKKLITKLSENRPEEVDAAEILDNVVKTSSNILEDTESWSDLSKEDQSLAATSLLTSVEDNSFLFADTVREQKSITKEEKNVMVEVRVVPKLLTDQEFKVYNENRTEIENWLKLSKNSVKQSQINESLSKIIFASFEKLDHILTFENPYKVVNSKIISASLGKGRHIKLYENVNICLKHLRTHDVANPKCVFWDYTAWSDEGCTVEHTNVTHTLCSCDHLTNFAILMDVQATYLPPVHETSLQVITYIGCTISIVCLLLAFLTFQIFRSLKSDRTTIHKHLSLNLLIAEILFLIGIDQTDSPLFCGFIAAMLHYFFLVSFAWMFLEGYQLYVMLIEIFEAEKSRMRWYYLFAYGCPLLIVLISCLFDVSSYGSERYCWLKTDNFFIFSFVGPVIAVIVANLIFLSMAIYIMCKHSVAPGAKTKEVSKYSKVKMWLRGAIVLVFILGLTWTFGLLYLNKESVFMAYIFTALNSFQGLFIFVFHCLRSEKAQKEYKKLLKRYGFSCTTDKEVKGESRERRTQPQSVESTSVSSGVTNQHWSRNSDDNNRDNLSLGRSKSWKRSSTKSSGRDSGRGDSSRSETPFTQSNFCQQCHSSNNYTQNYSPDSCIYPGARYHTYTEIEDPVYEEIQRNYTNEDIVRPETSHPLIPRQQTFQTAFETAFHQRLRDEYRNHPSVKVDQQNIVRLTTPQLPLDI